MTGLRYPSWHIFLQTAHGYCLMTIESVAKLESIQTMWSRDHKHAETRKEGRDKQGLSVAYEKGSR